MLNSMSEVRPLKVPGVVSACDASRRARSCWPSDSGGTAYAWSRNGLGVGVVQLFARSMSLGTVMLTAEYRGSSEGCRATAVPVLNEQLGNTSGAVACPCAACTNGESGFTAYAMTLPRVRAHASLDAWKSHHPMSMCWNSHQIVHREVIERVTTVGSTGRERAIADT